MCVFIDIPLEAKIQIFLYLNNHDFLSASSACKNLRECFYMHHFWKHTTIVIENSRSAVEKLSFLTKFVKHTTSLHLKWHCTKTRSWKVKFNMENHIATLKYLHALSIAISKRPKYIPLETFKLCLQNPLCQTNDFINGILISKMITQESTDYENEKCKIYGLGYLVKSLLINCISDMKYFSSGFNRAILKCHAFDFYVDKMDKPLPMFDLHIGTDVCISHQRRNSFLFVSKPVLFMFRNFTMLKYMSIDWDQVCSKLLQALIDRANSEPMVQLNLIMHPHNQCQLERQHPTYKQWSQFVERNTNLEVCLTFISTFEGLCSAVKFIRNVHYLKLIECMSVDTNTFNSLIGYHQHSLRGIAFINIDSPCNYSNAQHLWVSVCSCECITCLSVIGHFMEEHDLVTICNKYGRQLKKFLVTKDHVVGSAEASNYLIAVADIRPIEKKLSKILCQNWKFLKSFKQPPLYYTDGKDNYIYF